MIRYTVNYSPAVWTSIQARVWQIAIDHHAPLNARRWFARLRTAIESLEVMPERNAVDVSESAVVGFEVHRMVFERTYLVFYTIDEPSLTVHVVLFRHGARSRP